MSKVKSVPVEDLLEALYRDLPPYQVLSDSLQAQVATAISTARINMGMNQKQFAEFMDVTQSQVSKWENGFVNFTIEKLCQIADKLNMECNITLRHRRPYVCKTDDNVVYLSFGSSPASSWIPGVGYSEEDLKEM